MGKRILILLIFPNSMDKCNSMVLFLSHLIKEIHSLLKFSVHTTQITISKPKFRVLIRVCKPKPTPIINIAIKSFS